MAAAMFEALWRHTALIKMHNQNKKKINKKKKKKKKKHI